MHITSCESPHCCAVKLKSLQYDSDQSSIQEHVARQPELASCPVSLPLNPLLAAKVKDGLGCGRSAGLGFFFILTEHSGSRTRWKFCVRHPWRELSGFGLRNRIDKHNFNDRSYIKLELNADMNHMGIEPWVTCEHEHVTECHVALHYRQLAGAVFQSDVQQIMTFWPVIWQLNHFLWIKPWVKPKWHPDEAETNLRTFTNLVVPLNPERPSDLKPNTFTKTMSITLHVKINENPGKKNPRALSCISKLWDSSDQGKTVHSCYSEIACFVGVPQHEM